jgi:hypothetical protein
MPARQAAGVRLPGRELKELRYDGERHVTDNARPRGRDRRDAGPLRSHTSNRIHRRDGCIARGPCHMREVEVDAVSVPGPERRPLLHEKSRVTADPDARSFRFGFGGAATASEKRDRQEEARESYARSHSIR